MDVKALIDLITSSGMSVVIIGYFLYKDYKFNDSILQVLGEVKEVLASLKTWHEADKE
jgi:hypothetical protein